MDGDISESTHEIIEAVKNGDFPDKVMMKFHPQRWTDDRFLWMRELVVQKVKNVVKGVLVRVREGVI